MKPIKFALTMQYLFFLLFLLSASSTPLMAADLTAEDVKRIAEEGKDPFIGAMALDYYRAFGASEAPKDHIIDLLEAINPNSVIHKELKENPAVVLGDPFQVFTIDTQDILNYTPDADLSSIVRPTTKWLVPVFIHKKARMMLTINLLDGEYRVVGVGLDDLSEYVAKNNRMGVKDKYSKFVRIYPASSNFIITDLKGKKKILPFSYTLDALGIGSGLADNEGLYEASDFMPPLISHLRHRILSEGGE